MLLLLPWRAAFTQLDQIAERLQAGVQPHWRGRAHQPKHCRRHPSNNTDHQYKSHALPLEVFTITSISPCTKVLRKLLPKILDDRLMFLVTDLSLPERPSTGSPSPARIIFTSVLNPGPSAISHHFPTPHQSLTPSDSPVALPATSRASNSFVRDLIDRRGDRTVTSVRRQDQGTNEARRVFPLAQAASFSGPAP